MAAALSADGRALTMAVVNPTEQARTVRLELEGGALGGQAQQWVITGPGRLAHNRPGAPRQVDIHTSAVTREPASIEAAPLSVTLRSLPVR